MPKRTKPSTPRRAKRTGGVKSKYKKRKYNLPRHKIRTAVGSNPNVHAFKRAYSLPVTVGVADTGNHVYLNTDSTVQIMTLHTKFNLLPGFEKFQELFSEYKITSIKHKLVPYYRNNVPTHDHFPGIPNYEIFVIPNNSSVRHEDLTAMTGDQFNKWANSTQRKSVRIMPSGPQVHWTKNPKVAAYKGPADATGGTAMLVMERPSYLNTNPTPIIVGGVDQTDVAHYGVVLCIRRVDGGNLTANNNSDTFQSMGWRMETDVYFNCRKVQNSQISSSPH